MRAGRSWVTGACVLAPFWALVRGVSRETVTPAGELPARVRPSRRRGAVQTTRSSERRRTGAWALRSPSHETGTRMRPTAQEIVTSARCVALPGISGLRRRCRLSGRWRPHRCDPVGSRWRFRGDGRPGAGSGRDAPRTHGGAAGWPGEHVGERGGRMGRGRRRPVSSTNGQRTQERVQVRPTEHRRPRGRRVCRAPGSPADAGRRDGGPTRRVPGVASERTRGLAGAPASASGRGWAYGPAASPKGPGDLTPAVALAGCCPLVRVTLVSRGTL